MTIYRERIISYFALGGIIFLLGFFYNSAIAAIIASNIGLWIFYSLILNGWFALIKVGHNPMDRVFGIRIEAVIFLFVVLGVILITTYFFSNLSILTDVGVWLLCLALDFHLSKIENRRRDEAGCRDRTGSEG